MKTTHRILLPVTLLCGILGAVLLRWFLGLQDEAGLLPSFHMAKVLLYVISAAYLAFLLLFTRRLSKTAPAQFTCGSASAICQVLAGLLLALSGFSEFLGSRSQIAYLIISICAALCLFMLAMGRFTGKAPEFWPALALCVCSIFFTFCFTRDWTRDPQMILRLFPVLAVLTAMLSAYHNAAISMEKSGVRGLQFWSQLALFFSIPALNSPHWIFYLAMVFMTASNCLYTGEDAAL